MGHSVGEVRELVIAIDGPAGAGKSTVAKALARDLGLNYLDTGAMYRALAWVARGHGLGPGDGAAAAELCRDLRIEFEPGDPQRVIVDGVDATTEIRTLEIGELASALSTHPDVRALLVARQQAMVSEGGYTLEGRDVTTVVAPDADVKVYLTASLEERARRRHLELDDKGAGEEFARVRREVETRDHRDITREDSPLSVANGATVIESGGLTPDEVVAKIKALIPGKYSKK